jgi:hypothetical protein
MSGFIDQSGWGDLFPSRATLQSQTTGAANDRGVPSTGWANVPNLVNLPCRVDMKGGEALQGVDGETAVSTHEVHFQIFHAAITEKMRLVVDGQIYNILLAGSDPMKCGSILKVRKVVG